MSLPTPHLFNYLSFIIIQMHSIQHPQIDQSHSNIPSFLLSPPELAPRFMGTHSNPLKFAPDGIAALCAYYSRETTDSEFLLVATKISNIYVVNRLTLNTTTDPDILLVNMGVVGCHLDRIIGITGYRATISGTPTSFPTSHPCCYKRRANHFCNLGVLFRWRRITTVVNCPQAAYAPG